MKLNFRKYGVGQPLVILHGLFGSSDNWQTLGKKFAENYEVYLVDLRNHGKSPHSDAFTYELMAQDVYEFFRENHLYDAFLIGHSMGGKTAIQFASMNADLLEKLIVVDIGIKQYPMHHGEILEGLNAVNPGTLSSRSEAEEIISKYIESEGVRQFLLKNLYWIEKGKLAWRFNLPVLEREMENIIAPLELDAIRTETMFIRGAMSNYILDSDYDDIRAKFEDVRIETIEDAGHWVHAEAPEEFYNLVTDFISQT